MDDVYRSELNKNTAVASPGEFSPLNIGPLKIWPPVILAPMAGVTNYPFRDVCRRFGAGLYVSEMITARPLVEGRTKTWRLAGFGETESPRSLQLYGVDPYYVGEAVKLLVGEGRVEHIDMNFGCPVRKVTRKGGGSALPLKPNLLRNIVRAAVKNAGDVPITIKFRMGINDAYRTDIQTGRIAEEEGCAAVTLHSRTAAQLYDGEARWEAIAELKAALKIPVLGNGDIWEGHDALRMMRLTVCDGVVVGRGCLGKPWLFRDLVDVFEGREPQNPPKLGEVVSIMLDHAELLCQWMGEDPAMRSFRRFTSWYTKGFRGSAALRGVLMNVSSLEQLKATVANLDPNVDFPPTAMRVPRCKSSGTQVVALPDGYLEQLDDDTPPDAEAEDANDGG